MNYTESEVDTKLAGKASSSHNHDSRYYTESETDTLLAGKSDTNHNHDAAYAALNHNHDSAYSALNHTHDNRYYTESETDTLLDEKADSTMIAPAESAAAASHNYTADDLIVIGQQLLRATANIASGSAITIGTNAEVVTIDSILKEKANAISVIPIQDTAEFHNSVPRGKDISSYFTDGSLQSRISGTNGYKLFEDLWLGDTITRNGRTYMIVDFDYYIRCGETGGITAHHIVLMPVGNMSIPAGTVLYGSSDTLTFLNGSDVTNKETATAFKWNATAEAPNTNTTAGGYKYSRMRTIIMKAADTLVINDFGSNYITPINVLYPNPADAAASGLASGWTWFNSTDWNDILRRSICDLPNETQIYGQQVWGRGSAYTNVGYEVGIDKWQFSYFRMNRDKVNIRATWWLRSVYSAAHAAAVGGDGNANYLGSSIPRVVRPRFCLFGN